VPNNKQTVENLHRKEPTAFVCTASCRERRGEGGG
jgi:hypothetical protein